MKYEFPAIFSADDDCVAVQFYDSADWYTCGDNLKDAVLNAQDILNAKLLRLEKAGAKIPKATAINEVKLKEYETVRIISADTDKYESEIF